MLTELRICGLGVIDDAVFEPGPGLTAVTGETGAGKTMVVTALGLIAGGRADSSRVRSGSGRAVVEARIELAAGHPVAALVESAGGRADDDGSVILVRSVSAEGRSRAHAGGRSVPLALLAELSGSLFAVHGQHDAIALLQPAQQRAVLDQVAGTDDLLAGYRQARARWQTAVAELDGHIEHARERARREQSLRLGVAEIDRVAPTPGEDADVVAEIRRRENIDGLRDAAHAAAVALAGGDRADRPDVATDAVQMIETARRVLLVAQDPRLIAHAGTLHEASAVLTDVVAELSSYLAELDADPARLEHLLTRQAALRTLTRRYGGDIDAVLAWRAGAIGDLEALSSSEHTTAELQRRCEQAVAATRTAAAALSAARVAAATQLSAAATAELGQLAMPRAQLRVEVAPRAAPDTGPGHSDVLEIDGRPVIAGADGIDTVTLLLRVHPAGPELPVARAASGGELSRVMLAVEVVLAAADPVDTLVFDEVDAGVGGRAATEIGRRLALLGRTHQVIVVTHLAQVAAFADQHVVVAADADGTVGISSLRTVDGAAREVELARMLAGTEGATGRAHAAELLAQARETGASKVIRSSR